jgi:aspartyl-tRNA synthetase
MLTIKNYNKLKGERIITHAFTESWKVWRMKETKTAYEIILKHQDPFTSNGKQLIIKIERDRPDRASEYEYVINLIEVGIGVLRRYIIRIENIDTMDSMMHELKTIIESN